MQPDWEVPDMSITAQQTKAKDKATSSNDSLREAPNENEANNPIEDEAPLERQVIPESSQDEILESQPPPSKKGKERITPHADQGGDPNPIPNEIRSLSGLKEEAPPRPIMEEDWEEDYKECPEFGPLFQLVEAGGKD